MLGERGPQRELFGADNLYADFVGRDSFYGFLASQRNVLFRDEDFAELYNAKNGRPSVPPSLLATALVLQTFQRVSDQEAKQRADYDLRWKVALGIEVDERPFAKSTLQEFRAELVIHKEVGILFRRSLELAKAQGYFRGKPKLRVALDTTFVLGRGAVKDTYNLLADGIVLVLRVLALQAGKGLVSWAEEEGFGRYVNGQSLKGQGSVKWDDPEERQRFLQGIVADADRALELVRLARSRWADDAPEDQALVEASGLLSRLLAQDIERRAEGPALREGVARDRLVSAHDPDMRHGRKSRSRRFDGHKAQLAVDTESQLITAVAVLPGNAPDNADALEVVAKTEEATGCAVEESIGDCAYGDGGTRQAFADAERRLIAKVPAMTNRGMFPKTQFQIDVSEGTCTCPGGQMSRELGAGSAGGGVFRFAAEVCSACPLRSSCVRGRGGRTVQLHPQEQLLQEARHVQASPSFALYRSLRQVVEHRLARLVQLGIRQARYHGRVKTLFQLFMTAAVANLTLLAYQAMPGATSPVPPQLLLAFPVLSMSIVLATMWLTGDPCASNHARKALPKVIGVRHSTLMMHTLGSPTPTCRPDF